MSLCALHPVGCHCEVDRGDKFRPRGFLVEWTALQTYLVTQCSVLRASGYGRPTVDGVAIPSVRIIDRSGKALIVDVLASPAAAAGVLHRTPRHARKLERTQFDHAEQQIVESVIPEPSEVYDRLAISFEVHLCTS